MVLNKRVCIECLEKLCPDGGHVWRKDAVDTIWYHPPPSTAEGGGMVPPILYYRHIKTLGSTSLSVKVTCLHKYLERALEDATVGFYHPYLEKHSPTTAGQRQRREPCFSQKKEIWRVDNDCLNSKI